jgi:phenylpyruvate tautomerase PptA (4-oxalocrotonate tautomerase family)
MPLITLTIRKGRPADFKRKILDSVHEALVENGVPMEDKFHRVFELEATDFDYHATYPDLNQSRSDNFVLIEILLSVGRSVKIKKQIVQKLIENIKTTLKISAEEVMIVFVETRWENWSFGGGRFIHT